MPFSPMSAAMSSSRSPHAALVSTNLLSSSVGLNLGLAMLKNLHWMGALHIFIHSPKSPDAITQQVMDQTGSETGCPVFSGRVRGMRRIHLLNRPQCWQGM